MLNLGRRVPLVWPNSLCSGTLQFWSVWQTCKGSLLYMQFITVHCSLPQFGAVRHCLLLFTKFATVWCSLSWFAVVRQHIRLLFAYKQFPHGEDSALCASTFMDALLLQGYDRGTCLVLTCTEARRSLHLKVCWSDPWESKLTVYCL